MRYTNNIKFDEYTFNIIFLVYIKSVIVMIFLQKPLPYNQPVQTYVNSPQPYGNALGSGEVIQQSGSFKRLMYHVMAESNF